MTLGYEAIFRLAVWTPYHLMPCIWQTSRYMCVLKSRQVYLFVKLSENSLFKEPCDIIQQACIALQSTQYNISTESWGNESTILINMSWWWSWWVPFWSCPTDPWGIILRHPWQSDHQSCVTSRNSYLPRWGWGGQISVKIMPDVLYCKYLQLTYTVCTVQCSHVQCAGQ